MRHHTRRIEFIGNQKSDDILIGNYGAVKFLARGSFELSGIVYCLKHPLELTLQGEGIFSLRGTCKKLIIKKMTGNCTVDLAHVKIREFWCERVKDQSVITLGETDKIVHANLEGNAALKHSSKTLLMGYSLSGHAKIEKQEKLIRQYNLP